MALLSLFTRSRTSLFVPPDLSIYETEGVTDYRGCQCYAHYNYLRRGIIPTIKRRRFEKALALAQPWFHSTGAIDLGCADGVLLPSLSRYFSNVVGIDNHLNSCKHATNLVKNMGLSNTSVINNSNISIEELLDSIPPTQYSVMFLLETLEHVGQQENVYESKLQFIREMFRLLDHNGVIIASVPKMVGFIFLAKYLIQKTARQHAESYSINELISSGVFKNTDRLEAEWKGGHKGFNHLKLDRILQDAFKVQIYDTIISRFYLISSK